MTAGEAGYLLDANVLREAGARGHLNVRAWLRSVPERALFISAVTVLEARRGWEVRRRREPELAEVRLAGLAALEEAYAGRIVPVDRDIAAEWARLLGEHDRNRDDTALAATARVLGLVVVTRNMRHFRGRGVRVLDPFNAMPAIMDVSRRAPLRWRMRRDPRRERGATIFRFRLSGWLGREASEWRRLRVDPDRTFAVLLDTSASMNRRLLARALGATAQLASGKQVRALRLVYCDAAPVDAGWVSPEELMGRMEVSGRGDTVLQDGVDLIGRLDLPADTPLLVITDGLCGPLRVRRPHAYLVPAGMGLPFRPDGPVFRML